MAGDASAWRELPDPEFVNIAWRMRAFVLELACGCEYCRNDLRAARRWIVYDRNSHTTYPPTAARKAVWEALFLAP